MGAAMAGSAGWTARGAEISERSPELVLPEDLSGAVQQQGAHASREAASSGRESVDELERPTVWQSAGPPEQETGGAGQALPGDRGARAGYARRPERRDQEQQEPQRPSFWRRIALGRRASHESAPRPQAERTSPSVEARASTQPAPSETSKSLVETGPTALGARDVENRIVEPMLQALVSVEAKLERSHVELMGRSDQVEQRLSQLWDIEEQLGALGELQESLLQVSEQQRRLESAIRSQTRTLLWLVGALFGSLAVAAFVVAAVLR